MPTSKVKQLADEEAERVEREEAERENGAADDTADDTAAEPPPNVDPETGELTADDGAVASINAAEQLEREVQRHTTAVRRILGDAAEAWDVCEFCESLGFRPPTSPVYKAGLVRCETCRGYGRLLTPSLADGMADMGCDVCNGRGYREQAEIAPPYVPPPTPAPLTNGTPAAPTFYPGYALGYMPGPDGLPVPIPGYGT